MGLEDTGNLSSTFTYLPMHNHAPNAHHAVTNLPCMLSIHNQAIITLPCSTCNRAVTNLPCSQCTIMQSPTSLAPNVQSCSHQPPLLPMYNRAVTNLPCSQCTSRQSPTSHASNVQSCSHLPPMLLIHTRQSQTSHALSGVTNLPCYIHMQSES